MLVCALELNSVLIGWRGAGLAHKVGNKSGQGLAGFALSLRAAGCIQRGVAVCCWLGLQDYLVAAMCSAGSASQEQLRFCCCC